MPARAASLRITEAYRSRMIGLRNRAKAQARRTWAKVDIDALDQTFNPGMLILQVSALQREAARLSAGYLGAFVASETGEPIKLPVAMALQVNKARTGSSLSKAFRTPLIGVKLQIKDGKEPIQALREGGRQLTETVGLAVDEAAREALRIAQDQTPEVVGFQRAVKGTCEACMGLADGSTLPAGTELDIHPNCNCVAEPQVRPQQPQAKPVDPRPLTSAETKSLQDYVEGMTPNEMLRTGGQVNEDVRVLDNLIAAKGEQTPGTVYRFVDFESFDSAAKQTLQTVGKEFSDPAFASTSVDKDFVVRMAQSFSSDPLVFEIKGARGISVDKHIPGFLQEIAPGSWEQHEWLLPRGTRFRVGKRGSMELEGVRYNKLVLEVIR